VFAGSTSLVPTRLARAVVSAAVVAVCLAAVQCGGSNQTTGPTPPPTTTVPGEPPGTPQPGGPVLPTPSAPQVFAGAGDIAMCNILDGAIATGRLLEGMGGTVFTLGDNAYDHGTAKEFRECYDPAWGRVKGQTRPTLGNHEYEAGADPNNYFDYFGTSAAGARGQGYYSFELGPNWHAIALNSNIAHGRASPQGQFLINDLAASRTKCTIAYWHHPLFTSGQNGPTLSVRDLWRILYDANVDIVLNGHDHLYERFRPQDPDGRPDPQRGIQQFIVGTGGAFLYDFITMAPNSERRLRMFGVLKLTLDTDTYRWEFVQASSGAALDSGTGTCH